MVFIAIDALFFIVVMFPIAWSGQTSKEAFKTDGRAARNLAKLMFFKRLYVAVAGYLIVIRIPLYMLDQEAWDTNGVRMYQFVGVVAEEIVTMAFYVAIFYMLRPVVRNEHRRKRSWHRQSWGKKIFLSGGFATATTYARVKCAVKWLCYCSICRGLGEEEFEH